MFSLRRAAARAFSLATTASCPSTRIASSRVPLLRSTTSPIVRSFSHLQPRSTDQKPSEIPAGQEDAATSESTDAIPDTSSAESASEPAAVNEDQAIAATSESTDAIPAAQEAGSVKTNSEFNAGREQDSAESQKPTTIYMGNLSWEVGRPQLEEQCARYGVVTQTRMSVHPDGTSKGYGFVSFATHEEAQAAAKALDGVTFQGRTLRARLADGFNSARKAARRESHAPSKTVYVGNLSFDMSDRELNELFRDIKNVLDVRVAIDRRTGQPRGFAHADFPDIESAKAAQQALSGKTVHGRNLKVDFAPNSKPAVAR